MTLTSDFGINEDVIKVNNDETIKFYNQSFVEVALKASRGVKKTKKYNLILEIAVPHLEDCFLLITSPNPHSIIFLNQVQLS